MSDSSARAARAREMRALVRAFEASDLSLKDFCLLRGVAPSTLRYWMKKLAGRSSRSDHGRESELGTSPFAPLRILPDPLPSTSNCLEITLETGRRLSIPPDCDPELACRLLGMLV